MPLRVIISIEDDRWNEVLPDIAGMTDTIVNETLRQADQVLPEARQIEIGVTYADDIQIQALNLAWRKKNKPTNVLSFPAVNSENLPAGAPYLLGDIIIAIETVTAEAREKNASVMNHTKHLLIHGVLHLLGHDHMSDSDANLMESLEIKILSSFQISNPYILV